MSKSRSILFVLLVLAMMSFACQLTSQPEPAAIPTAAVQGEAATPTTMEAPPTEAPAPTEPAQPADTSAPTEEPTATEVQPTETEPGPISYTETFDHNNEDWSEDLIVTTQTSGRDLDSKAMITNGLMSIRLGDKETYLYKFFLYTTEGIVSIETEYLSRGHINNGIALVCRVNEDLTSWFEVRVSSTSDYGFYRYDKSLREEQGKNPYVQLQHGKIDYKELAPSKENTIKLTCTEDELILDVNHGKRILSQGVDTPLEGDFLGIGAMSYDVVPITIDFDNITIRQE